MNRRIQRRHYNKRDIRLQQRKTDQVQKTGLRPLNFYKLSFIEPNSPHESKQRVRLGLTGLTPGLPHPAG